MTLAVMGYHFQVITQKLSVAHNTHPAPSTKSSLPAETGSQG